MKTLRILAASAIGAASIALATAPAFAGDSSYKAETAAKPTIVEAAMNTEALSTLVAAVKAADLVETLNGPGPYTVFAPTNDAFAALPAGTVDTLLLPENKDKLSYILTAHVVAGKLTAADIIGLAEANNGMVEVETVAGATLTAKLKEGKLYVKDEMGGKASVAIADVMTSNGVVHVVDTVLLPSKDGNS